MTTSVSHAGGLSTDGEILFSTPFGYMFPDLVHSEACVLAHSERTQDALLDLGAAMGEAATDDDLGGHIPAVYTYLGQFIDHDITARTDREAGRNSIAFPDGRARPLTPLHPDEVTAMLANGRRPHLDLDSVYGDGPSLLPAHAGAATTAAPLYRDDLTLDVQKLADGFDVPRGGLFGGAQSTMPGETGARRARIADMRNDENLNVNQLHAAMLAFHNAVVAALGSSGDPISRYAEARRRVRWAYQYVVLNDYLPRVCDPNIVLDIKVNGPKFFAPSSGRSELYMPLEFSVAAFRFGHSMVRGEYMIRGKTSLKITDILGVTAEPGQMSGKQFDLLTHDGNGYRVKDDFVIEWCKFAEFSGREAPQKARLIDTRLADGLFKLSFEAAPIGAMLRQLAQRNLLRGYLLRMPTGQAVARAMGVEPMTEGQIVDGESVKIVEAIERGRFQNQSPLWYYLLREAAVHTGGKTLGAIGSRIVAETLIGLVKTSPNSYVAYEYEPTVTHEGIEVAPGAKIATVADLLSFAGVPI